MIENTILAHLVFNEEYVRRVLPFLKSEYFSDQTDQKVFDLITGYVNKYNGTPTREALLIELESIDGMNEKIYENSYNLIKDLNAEKSDIQWLVDTTEKFCQDRAIVNGIMTSLSIIEGTAKGTDKGAIPTILSDALAVSFNKSVGHDYFADADERYDFYHRKESRIPFDIDRLNMITKGGLPRKTLNIILAGTGVGKTLFMCHAAAANVKAGYKVLYITLEMAKERIAERIDANLLNVTLDDLVRLPKDMYQSRIKKVRDKTVGDLVIEEYPTASAGVNHFRHLLNELKLKKNFTPDIIYIDYINIAASVRIKAGQNANSYTYVKAIAEEFRGLAVEFDVPLISATQTNRTGFADVDVELTDTSESFGLPMTADFMIALSTSDELEALKQMQIKQLKNRYNDIVTIKKFVIGVDRPKMRLFNLDDGGSEPQQDDDDDKPIFDMSLIASRDTSDKGSKFKQFFKQK
jgi:replicative DNA helicase